MNWLQLNVLSNIKITALKLHVSYNRKIEILYVWCYIFPQTEIIQEMHSNWLNCMLFHYNHL